MSNELPFLQIGKLYKCRDESIVLVFNVGEINQDQFLRQYRDVAEGDIIPHAGFFVSILRENRISHHFMWNLKEFEAAFERI